MRLAIRQCLGATVFKLCVRKSTEFPLVTGLTQAPLHCLHLSNNDEKATATLRTLRLSSLLDSHGNPDGKTALVKATEKTAIGVVIECRRLPGLDSSSTPEYQGMLFKLAGFSRLRR